MPERPTPTRRRTPVRRAPARPRPTRIPVSKPAPRVEAAQPRWEPAQPPRIPELPPGVRFIAWALLLGGFAGIATALGGALVLSHDPEGFAPQRDQRFGLVVGAAAVLAVDGLAVATGIQLLAVRDWGRLAAVVLCTLGLFGSTVASGVAYFGGLLDTWAPVDPSFVGFALVATVTAAIFFGWAIPVLLESSTVELFRGGPEKKTRAVPAASETLI